MPWSYFYHKIEVVVGELRSVSLETISNYETTFDDFEEHDHIVVTSMHPMIEEHVQVVICSLLKYWDTVKIQQMHANTIETFINVQKHCKMEEDRLNAEKSVFEVNVVEYKKHKVSWVKNKIKGKGKGQIPKDVGSVTPTKKHKKELNKANA